MKKTYLLLLVSISGVLTMTSCKKDETSVKIPYYPMPQEIKDFMWFEVGSFWVYEDSVSKQLDTIKIYNTVFNTNKVPIKKTSVIEHELLEVQAKSLKTQDSYNFHAGLYSDRKTNGVVILNTSSDNPEKIKRSELMNYPYTLFKVHRRYPGDFILRDTLESYTVLGKTYKNVKLYYYEIDGMMDYEPTLTWIAPNYGIIKKECLTYPNTMLLKTSSLTKKM